MAFQRRQSGRAPDGTHRVLDATSVCSASRRRLAATSPHADGRPGSPRTVIVSQSFWRQRLGGRVDAIGKPVTLDGVDYTLIGVLPPTNGPFERGQHFFIAAQWPTPTRKGPFFIRRSRPTAARVIDSADRAAASAELRAINKRLFDVWKSSYQDSRATWSLIDLKTYAAGDLQTVGGAGARRGRVRLADRLHERLEPAHRTRQQPAAGAGGAYRTRRLARAHRPLPARRERSCSRSVPRPSESRIAWSGIGLLRELATDYVPRSQEIALDGTTGWLLLALTLTSGRALRPDPGAARHGRSGRRGAARVGTIVHRHRLGPAPAPHPRRVAVRDHDAAPHRRRAAAGESAPARARRSRLRHAQPDHRLDHRPELDVPPSRDASSPTGISCRRASKPCQASRASRTATACRQTSSTTSTTSISRTSPRRPDSRSR